MPICEQVRRMLFEGQRPEVALRELMSRATRPESDQGR
jgi:glycerol-3-phosphate dehydrogenase